MPAAIELERLYDDHAQALFGFLLNFTRNEADTRDLLQELFIKLARSPALLEGMREPRAFLLRLAHNMAIDLIRRRGTREKNYAQWADEAVSMFAAKPEPDEQPFTMPVPNFIVIRNAAQTLAQRAQCYLLLGQPDAALRELTLVHDLCRLLEGKPSGKPMPLISAMIDVAVTGLYAGIVADGLRLQTWREPESLALQQQLKEINLLVPFTQSLQSERASACRRLEAKSADLVELRAFGERRPSLWERTRTPEFWLLRWMPQGWVYQNMAAIASRNEWIVEAVDLPNGLVLPRKMDATSREMQTTFGHFSPYSVLATIAFPNYVKATQTTARNQTMANEALIACALERYRLAHNEYPENLTALAPQFVEKLPSEIVNGQPLKYRRTGADQFLLYSVGWNEIDDGGVPGKTNVEGDWVWEPQKP